MENEKTLTGPNVLHLLGLVCTLMFSFFGLLYMLKGNEVYSGLIALIFAFIFFILVFNLCKFKAKVTRSSFSIQEIVLLVFYLIAALIAAPSTFHFVNTEFMLKDKIRVVAMKKIERLKDIQIQYDQAVDQNCNDMKVDLDQLINDYANIPPGAYNRARQDLIGRYGIQFSSEHILTKTEFKKNLLKQRDDLLGIRRKTLTEGFDRFKEDNQEYIASAQDVFNNWRRIKLNSTFYDLDIRLINNLNFLRARMKNFKFELPSEKEIDLSSPSGLIRSGETNILLPSLLLFIVHFMLLFPYLTTKRPDKRRYDRTGGPRGLTPFSN